MKVRQILIGQLFVSVANRSGLNPELMRFQVTHLSSSRIKLKHFLSKLFLAGHNMTAPISLLWGSEQGAGFRCDSSSWFWATGLAGSDGIRSACFKYYRQNICLISFGIFSKEILRGLCFSKCCISGAQKDMWNNLQRSIWRVGLTGFPSEQRQRAECGAADRETPELFRSQQTAERPTAASV